MVRTRFIILEILSQLLIVGNGSVQRLASREALPKFGPFLADLGISQQERSAVEVVPPLSILSSLPGRAVSDHLLFVVDPFLHRLTIMLAPWFWMLSQPRCARPIGK